jgi:hypothetical protein
MAPEATWEYVVSQSRNDKKPVFAVPFIALLHDLDRFFFGMLPSERIASLDQSYSSTIPTMRSHVVIAVAKAIRTKSITET